MSNVVILNGSPRKKGYTASMLREVAKGVEEGGGTVIWRELNSNNAKPCQGCDYCQTHGVCCIKDDLSEIFDRIVEADSVVLGSPNYFSSISGQAKVWLDRMSPMHESDSAEVRHPGKQFMTVYTQGNKLAEAFAASYDYTDNCLRDFGWKQIDRILVTSTLDTPGYQLSDEEKNRAYDDGKKLAQFVAKPYEEAILDYHKLMAASGFYDLEKGEWTLENPLIPDYE